MTDEKAKIDIDVTLFEDFQGERVTSDKRFPGGKFRLYLPVPTTDEEAQKMYNKTLADLIKMGVNQNSHNERDYDSIKLKGEKVADVSDEAQVANVCAGLGVENLQDATIVEKAKAFFETAHFTEKKERTVSEEKQTMKRMKQAGISDISDEEMAAIKAMREKRQAKEAKAAK